MPKNEYTWKCGFEYTSRTKMTTNRPLYVNKLIIDLFDGRRYQVDAIHPAKPTDREWSDLPDTVVHTWPAGVLSNDELSELRERAGYERNEYSCPLEAVVFDV